MTERQIYNEFKRRWQTLPSSFIKENKDWYRDMNNWILQNSVENYSFAQCVGIFSNLSPMKSVEENKKLYLNFLNGKKGGHFKTQIKKCEKIANLDNPRPALIDFYTKGFKTISFWRNIFNPFDDRYVTVDRHIIKIAYKGEQKQITPKRYRTISSCIKQLAKEVKLKPNQVQSVLWANAKILYGNNI